MRIMGIKRFGWVLALSLVSVACSDDDPTEVEEEPEFTTMRLVVGAQTVNITRANCSVSGGPINLGLNTATAVSATFLLANGSADPVVTSAGYELRVTPANANLTFTRTGPFAGTLRGTTAGQTTAKVELYSTEHGHPEVECLSVPITVQAGGLQ